MWLRTRDFAEKHGVSTSAVRQRIKSGSIPNRKNNGSYEVWDQDQSESPEMPLASEETGVDSAYTQALTRKAQLENKLKEQKLKNLTEDTELKKQRNRDYIEQVRREFAEDVFQCFTESFSDLKSLFIEMRFDKEQNQKLKQVFGKAIKDFRERLLKYLEKGKKEEQEKNEE